MTPDLAALVRPLPDPVHEDVPAGAAVPGPGLRVVLDGGVSLRCDGRAVGFVDGPTALDLDALLAGRPPRAWRAETRVRVARWPDVDPQRIFADPGALAAAARLLAGAVGALEDHRSDVARALDDCFTPAGLLPAPPYRFDPVEGVLLAVQSDPAQLAALRPPSVRRVPGLGGRWLLLISDLRSARVDSADGDGRRFAYREVTVLLPAVVRGRPGAYVPALWPDSPMATALGREIYGFPKRVARIRLDGGGVDLVVDGERWLRARWTRGPERTAAELAEEVAGALAPGLPATARAWIGRTAGGLCRRGFGAPMATFVRRRIPDLRRPGRQRDDELVEVPMRLNPPRAVRRLVDIELVRAGGVPDGEVLGGWVLTTGFGLGAARIVRRYGRSAWRG